MPITSMARPVHSSHHVWSHILVATVGVVLSLVAVGCIIPSDPEYRDAGPPNYPPQIVFGSENPPFAQQQKFKGDAVVTFSVSVADQDLSQSLHVRFCPAAQGQGQQLDAEFLKTLVASVDVLVGPSTDGKPQRQTPVEADFDVCSAVNDTAGGGGAHYLFVVVTDGTFRTNGVGCDVSDGSGIGYGWWQFTCDPPSGP
jgi:hypothetical protein